MRRIPALDVLRGIAILLVVGHHFFVDVPPDSPAFVRAVALFFRRFGWTGVDLFFVLSGFLVGGLLFAEVAGHGRLRVGRFLGRRGFKIWPGYIALLLWMTATAWSGGLIGGVDAEVPPTVGGESPWALTVRVMWANWMHLQNYWTSFRVHTWSLAVEEHFYLVLPAFVALLARSDAIARRRTGFILSAVAAGALAARVATWAAAPDGADPLTTLAYPTHLRVDGLICGVLLAWVQRFRPRLWAAWQEHPRALLAGALVLVIPAGLGGSASPWVSVYGLTGLYLGYGLLLVAALAFRGDGTALPVKLVAGVGVYSYSIYLWHIDFAALPTRALAGAVSGWPLAVSLPALFVTQFALAIGAGIVMAKAVEFPFLRLRERVVPR